MSRFQPPAALRGLCLLDVHDLDGSLDHRDVFLSAAQKGRTISTCVSRVACRDGVTGTPAVTLALP